MKTLKNPIIKNADHNNDNPFLALGIDMQRAEQLRKEIEKALPSLEGSRSELVEKVLNSVKFNDTKELALVMTILADIRNEAEKQHILLHLLHKQEAQKEFEGLARPSMRVN